MSDAEATPAARRLPHLVVDAANVVGSRPDGWWRDRAGATRRLLAAIGDWATRDGRWQVVVVLEGQARAAAAETSADAGAGIRVVSAAGSGDDAIVALVAELAGPVTVVTSDRGLRARLDVPAVGAGWLRERIDR